MALVHQNPSIDILCRLELAQLVQIRRYLLITNTIQRDFFNLIYNTFANSTTWLLIHTRNNLSRRRLHFSLEDLLDFLPLHERADLLSFWAFWGTYLLFLLTPSNRLLLVNPLREGSTLIEFPPLVRNFHAQAHLLKLVVDSHDMTQFQLLYAEHDRFANQTLLGVYSSVTNAWMIYIPQETVPGAIILELYDFRTRIPVQSVHHRLSRRISVNRNAPRYVNTFLNVELPPLRNGLHNYEYLYYYNQWLVVLRMTTNPHTPEDSLDGLFLFELGADRVRYHRLSSLPLDLIHQINRHGQRIQRRVCITDVFGVLHIAVPVTIGEDNWGMYWITMDKGSESWNITQRIEIPLDDFSFIAGHTFGCMRMPLNDF